MLSKICAYSAVADDPKVVNYIEEMKRYVRMLNVSSIFYEATRDVKTFKKVDQKIREFLKKTQLLNKVSAELKGTLYTLERIRGNEKVNFIVYREGLMANDPLRFKYLSDLDKSALLPEEREHVNKLLSMLLYGYDSDVEDLRFVLEWLDPKAEYPEFWLDIGAQETRVYTSFAGDVTGLNDPTYRQMYSVYSNPDSAVVKILNLVFEELVFPSDKDLMAIEYKISDQD